MKISVVYITNGKNLNVLQKCIDSSHFADEIIVVGKTDQIESNVIKIERPELAEQGRISFLRNLGAESATGDIIINADDDIYFPYEFKNKLIKFISLNPDLEIFTTKVLGINGSRYWDRTVHDKNGNSYMIDYHESHPDLYYSGAFVIRYKSFADRYKWDNKLKFYEKEDVEFSNRIKQDGYNINIDVENYVLHLDSNYISYRNGDNFLVCDRIGRSPTLVENEIQKTEYRKIRKLIKELNKVWKI